MERPVGEPPVSDGPAGERPGGSGALARAQESVPASTRALASVAWRALVIVAALYVLMRVIRVVWMPFLALSAAFLISALLTPLTDLLDHKLRFPRLLATVCTILVFLGALSGLGYFVETEFSGSVPELINDLQRVGDDILHWLHTGPLHWNNKDLSKYQDQFVAALKKQQSHLTQIGLESLASGVEVISGMLIALFTTIFLLYDGPGMWSWVRRLFPARVQPQVEAAGHAAWGTLTGYARGTVIVAAIDGTCIGVGLAILQVPLAAPVAVLIFLGAFIPIVGALITGTVAVLIALVTQGWVVALITLGILIAVMQMEGHVLQPFVLGRSVRVHPVAVVFAVAIGTTLWGIGGAVLSVPVVAVTNSALSAIYRSRRASPHTAPEGAPRSTPPSVPPP